ncbi:LysR family transcriptional regulator [Mitsuaria sp. GD03876]|uniref:LysR family transcriptional regulator n=1 Tax=Mitsuaria sp. GD03876 TaxID=2975399 RepID=UPI002449FC70|nr:LysR family transcriptional regulator [Mitsuaria sp. GD03876]MDH0865426.1 LysR family transcriptional regulator [Mitsuaria sp. GD03876]
MDKLDAMAIFVAVVQEGGFSAAARRLGVSAPVVTRAVSELEAAMKVRLLVRTTRVVKVTEVGERYAQDCRRLLGELQDIEQAASGSHGAVKGRLVVSASVMYGRLKLNTVVLDYLRRYPEAEVECRLLDRNVNLLNDDVDVAIRIGALPDASFHATPLATVRRIVCASPGYLKRHGTPKRPEDLARHALVAALGVEPGHDWKFRAGPGAEAATVAVPVRPRLATNNNDHAILAASEGLGLTRVLSYMVEAQIADGTLVEVLAKHAPPAVPVQALQHQGLLASRKVRAFIDLAVEHLRR